MLDPPVPAVLHVMFGMTHVAFFKPRNRYERPTCLSRTTCIQDVCLFWPHTADIIDPPVGADFHVIYNILEVCLLDITADIIIPALLQALFRYNF
jgi:hypothetical protein